MVRVVGAGGGGYVVPKSTPITKRCLELVVEEILDMVVRGLFV